MTELTIPEAYALKKEAELKIAAILNELSETTNMRIDDIRVGGAIVSIYNAKHEYIGVSYPEHQYDVELMVYLR